MDDSRFRQSRFARLRETKATLHLTLSEGRDTAKGACPASRRRQTGDGTRNPVHAILPRDGPLARNVRRRRRPEAVTGLGSFRGGKRFPPYCCNALTTDRSREKIPEKFPPSSSYRHIYKMLRWSCFFIFEETVLNSNTLGTFVARFTTMKKRVV